MSILLWITIKMEYIIKSLNFFGVVYQWSSKIQPSKGYCYVKLFCINMSVFKWYLSVAGTFNYYLVGSLNYYFLLCWLLIIVK